MADDKWTDEEVRYFFALYADEKKKGNRPRSGMNLAGREFIVNKFEEKFGKRWIWDRFKNKVDISRKAYVKFKKLTHNRTGLVYDALGRLEMPDAWWDQRIAEWQGARKYKTKVPPNMDVFEAEFGAVTVTGAEGWCAQQGEASLDSRVDAEKDDESDSVDTEICLSQRDCFIEQIEVLDGIMFKEEDGDGHGGHIPYEPTGDRAMEGLRDRIGNELSRGYRLPY
ncbi:uncharacterized protein LOC106453666 isoform X2 [Brassica napus]|uniref:uncharacterized protein LOC106453666 isoform X2 n=1 Tax=Brassica napus TaxID=3708 RepID=UPI0020787DC7|nr:uncharacterized protein LOC106453666 isoform X2 [Brassica napus]